MVNKLPIILVFTLLLSLSIASADWVQIYHDDFTSIGANWTTHTVDAFTTITSDGNNLHFDMNNGGDYTGGTISNTDIDLALDKRYKIVTRYRLTGTCKSNSCAYVGFLQTPFGYIDTYYGIPDNHTMFIARDRVQTDLSTTRRYAGAQYVENTDTPTNEWWVITSYTNTSTTSGSQTVTYTSETSPYNSYTITDSDYDSTGNIDGIYISGVSRENLVMDTYYDYITVYEWQDTAALQTITFTNATEIGQFNVTLVSDFTYEDATEVEAYWVINGVNQTSTNYTVGTSHDQTITGLDSNTLYEYELCLGSELGTVCSDTKNFTTLPSPPYIYTSAVEDITTTQATFTGSYNDADYNQTASYFRLNGVQQSPTFARYNPEIPVEVSLDITGLEQDTTYNMTYCVLYDTAYSQIICDDNVTFTTLAIPSIDTLTAVDITNHEATLRAIVLYGGFDTMWLEYTFNNTEQGIVNYSQIDEFDTDVTYELDLTELSYSTTYNYSLAVTYTDPNGIGGNNDDFKNGYRINGTNSYYRIGDANGIPSGGDPAFPFPIDESIITSSQDCVDLCNRFVGDGLANDGGVIDVVTQGNGTCWYVEAQDECYIGDDDTFLWFAPGTEGNYYSLYMNGTATVNMTFYSSELQFTTDEPYDPFIYTSVVEDISGNGATFISTFTYQDYPSIRAHYKLNDVRLDPTFAYYYPDEPVETTLDVTNLSTNTTYNMTFCLEYGAGYALEICDDDVQFTTGFIPIVSNLQTSNINKTSATSSFVADFNGATNLKHTYHLSNGMNSTLINTVNGTNTYTWNGLTAETNYTWYVTVQYDTLGETYEFNSSSTSFTTYYENAFDDIWDTLLQGSSIAKILLGFVVVFGIVFLAVNAFGKYSLQIGMVGILIFTIIGTVLASLMKLFPLNVMLLIIAGCIILMVLKNTVFGGAQHG